MPSSHNPQFDVVIPAHNASATVSAAVRSAWNQRYKPASVTVVADACKDDTSQVAQQAGAKVVEVQARSVSIARNTGTAQGHSTWIAFLDADDLWQSSWLER